MPRPTTLKSAKAQADKAFSRYIRQKWADSNGNIKCVSCNIRLPWKESDCAHFIPRGAKACRFMEENARPACPSCNRFRPEMHIREFTLYMIDYYGREFVDELRAKAREITRLRKADYLEIAQNYRDLTDQL